MPRHIVNEGRVIGYSAYETYVKQLLSEDPTALPATEKEWLNSMVAFGDSMLLLVGTDTIEGPHYRDVAFPQDSNLCAANTIFADFFAGRGKPSANVARCNPGNAGTYWCKEVTDYGYLIHSKGNNIPNGVIGPDVNVSANHINAPNTDNTTSRNIRDWEPESLSASTTRNEMREYMKIIDGLIIHPGNWDNTAATNAAKVKAGLDSNTKLVDPDFKSDWPSYNDNKYPRLRIFFADRVDRPFYILLTGFTHKSIILGVTHTKSTGMLTDPHFPSPEDGAFLGPSEWPWAAKVIFTPPNAYLNYFYQDSYRRQLRPTTNPGNSSDGFASHDPLYSQSDPALVPADRTGVTQGQITLDQRVKLNPVIDMENTDPATYYARLHNQRSVSKESLIAAGSRIRLNVKDVTPSNVGGTDGLAVFTTYQRSNILPPALFGTKVTKTGAHADQSLNPIDTVAPGTLKVYHGHITDTSKTWDQPIEKARALELIPENRALLRKSSNYTWHQLDGNTQAEPVVSGTSQKGEQNIADLVPDIQSSSRNIIPVAETYYNQLNSGGIISKGFPGLNGAQPATTTDTFVSNEFIASGVFQHNLRSDTAAGRPQIVRITTGKQSKSVLSMEDACGVPYKTSGQTSATAFRDAINVSGREGDNGSYINVRKSGVPQSGGGTAGTAGPGNRSRRTGHGHGYPFQDNLSWDHLLQALSNNQRIDLLGDELKDLRDNLPNVISNGYLRIEGTEGSNPHALYNPRGQFTQTPAYTTDSNSCQVGGSGLQTNGGLEASLSWINHDLIIGSNNQAAGSLTVHGTRHSHIRGSTSIGRINDSQTLTVYRHFNTHNGTVRTVDINGTTGATKISDPNSSTSSSKSAVRLTVHGETNLKGDFKIQTFNSTTNQFTVDSSNGNTWLGTGASVGDLRLTVNGATHITGHTGIGKAVGSVVTSIRGYNASGKASLSVAGLVTGETLNSELNYIIVGGRRLFVCLNSSDVSGAQSGDIGIGWV